MQSEVTKPPRVYPFEIEPNDVTRHRKRAGKDLVFGDYYAFPTHSKDGSHRWWVNDWKLESMPWRDDDVVTVRSGKSFEEVTRDFKWCFEAETNSQSGV